MKIYYSSGKNNNVICISDFTHPFLEITINILEYSFSSFYFNALAEANVVIPERFVPQTETLVYSFKFFSHPKEPNNFLFHIYMFRVIFFRGLFVKITILICNNKTLFKHFVHKSLAKFFNSKNYFFKTEIFAMGTPEYILKVVQLMKYFFLKFFTVLFSCFYYHFCCLHTTNHPDFTELSFIIYCLSIETKICLICTEHFLFEAKFKNKYIGKTILHQKSCLLALNSKYIREYHACPEKTFLIHLLFVCFITLKVDKCITTNRLTQWVLGSFHKTFRMIISTYVIQPLKCPIQQADLEYHSVGSILLKLINILCEICLINTGGYGIFHARGKVITKTAYITNSSPNTKIKNTAKLTIYLLILTDRCKIFHLKTTSFSAKFMLPLRMYTRNATLLYQKNKNYFKLTGQLLQQRITASLPQSHTLTKLRLLSKNFNLFLQYSNYPDPILLRSCVNDIYFYNTTEVEVGYFTKHISILTYIPRYSFTQYYAYYRCIVEDSLVTQECCYPGGKKSLLIIRATSDFRHFLDQIFQTVQSTIKNDIFEFLRCGIIKKDTKISTFTLRNNGIITKSKYSGNLKFMIALTVDKNIHLHEHLGTQFNGGNVYTQKLVISRLLEPLLEFSVATYSLYFFLYAEIYTPFTNWDCGGLQKKYIGKFIGIGNHLKNSCTIIYPLSKNHIACKIVIIFILISKSIYYRVHFKAGTQVKDIKANPKFPIPVIISELIKSNNRCKKIKAKAAGTCYGFIEVRSLGRVSSFHCSQLGYVNSARTNICQNSYSIYLMTVGSAPCEQNLLNFITKRQMQRMNNNNYFSVEDTNFYSGHV